MSIKIKGYSMHNGDLNLAKMFRETVQKAIDKHPNCTYEIIACKLGISERTLHRLVRAWAINRPDKFETVKIRKVSTKYRIEM